MDWKTTTYQLDNGKNAGLNNLLGDKGLVLYFFPKAGTGRCTLEAKTFESRITEIKTKGYNVVGVSRDSLMEQEDFSKSCALSFPLICDVEEILHKEFDVLPKGDDKYSSRSTFVLDKDLNITIEMRNVHEAEHVGELITKL